MIKTIHLCKAQKRHFSHLLSPGEKILGRILPSSVTYGRIKYQLKTLSNTFIPPLLSERMVASRNLRNGFFFLLVGSCVYFCWATSFHKLSRMYVSCKTFFVRSVFWKLVEVAAGNRGTRLPFGFLVGQKYRSRNGNKLLLHLQCLWHKKWPFQ